MARIPSLRYERRYWQQGIRVAGVDEVGMGAWAGPVVAAAVILIPEKRLPGVRDSKMLSALQREKLAEKIYSTAVAWAIGEASVKEINELNIRGASHLAMRRAIASLSVAPQQVLLDGLPASPEPSIPTENIIDGDQVSSSIAAASIIAKVYRDTLMQNFDHQYPHFGFSLHKGYGTAYHRRCLRRFGACPLHRASFAPIKVLKRAIS
jgi:ribonuclease HII